MMPNLKYLAYVLRHKAFVLWAGLRLGLPLGRLLAHDLSKFSPAEWGPYVRRFYSGRGGTMDHSQDAEEWIKARDHHFAHNPHHPEFWRLTHYYRQRTLEAPWAEWANLILWGEYEPVRMGLLYAGKIDPVPMLPEFVTEMAADLIGAGYANGKPDVWTWYDAHNHHYPMHPASKAELERELERATELGLIPERRRTSV